MSLVSHKRSEQGNILLAALGLIILLGIGFAGYTYLERNTQDTTDTSSPTPTPVQEVDTSDWKTFENVEEGYSLKYPADWYLHQFDGSGELGWFIYSYPKEDTYYGGYDFFDSPPSGNVGIQIRTVQKPASIDVLQWISEQEYDPFGMGINNKSIDVVQKSTLTDYLSYSWSPLNTQLVMWVEDNDKEKLIHFFVNMNDFSVTIIESIVDSIRFLE